jgi:formylmethanofuran dehydrogenase subunit E
MGNEVREMIIALRGGVADKCDFCGEDTPEEDMHPEEAGQWACITCITRWEKEDHE